MMLGASHSVDPELAPSGIDQRVILHGSWSDYQSVLAIRGDRPAPRLYYLEGAIEIIRPSDEHEWMKKTIGRLLEAYADHIGLEFTGYGSLTMRRAPRARGAEPDECYAVGRARGKPDLAVEVMWTSGGLDKLAIYSGLGVQELWCVRRDKKERISLGIYTLRKGRYLETDTSRLLPDLDIRLLLKCLRGQSQSQSVRTFRAALRRRKPGKTRPARS